MYVFCFHFWFPPLVGNIECNKNDTWRLTGNNLNYLTHLVVYFTQLAALVCVKEHWNWFWFTLINFSNTVCHLWQVLAPRMKNNISNSWPKLWDNLWGVECHHLLRTCEVEVITARGGRAQLQLSPMRAAVYCTGTQVGPDLISEAQLVIVGSIWIDIIHF